VPILTAQQNTVCKPSPKLVLRLVSGLFLFSLLLGCQSEPNPQSPAGQALQRAAKYLWAQQSEDGGWHSQHHGLLKGGQVSSAFALDALLAIPDSIYRPTADQKAAGLQFLRDHTNSDGALGLHDPHILEYPNYATAYALKIFVHHGEPEDDALIGKMSSYLLAQQFGPERGQERSHGAYGGWGFGETVLMDGQVGHVDLSHTRKVLQALEVAGKLNGDIDEQARLFLHRLQGHPEADSIGTGLLELNQKEFDGGYVYSPMQADLNKGGEDSLGADPVYSYATATADGYLAERALGKEGTEAGEWLLKSHRWDYPEGIPHQTVQQWQLVMKYYHIMVRAEAYAELQPAMDWQAELVDFLIAEQLPDGSFSNPNGAPNKENDPHLATSMAIRALLTTL